MWPPWDDGRARGVTGCQYPGEGGAGLTRKYIPCSFIWRPGHAHVGNPAVRQGSTVGFSAPEFGSNSRATWTCSYARP
jgi:hypothetical protein